MKKSFRSLLVFLTCLLSVSVAQEYIMITRRTNSKYASNPFTNKNADLFKLPPSLCGETRGDTECLLMGARKTGDCQCVCDMKDGKGLTYKNTFGFYDGKWKCQNNTAVRNDTGCLLSQYGDIDIPIPTIGQSYSSFRLQNRDRIWRCYDMGLRQYNLTYLNCNGTWESINSTVIKKAFKIRSRHFYAILLRIHTRYIDALPAGRLIRLQFRCRHPPSTPPCFLLKVIGNLSCHVPSMQAASETSTSASTKVISISSPRTTSLSPSATSTDRNKTLVIAATSDFTSLNTAASSTLIGVLIFGIVILITGTVVTVMAMKRYMRRRREKNDERLPNVVGEELKSNQGNSTEGNAEIPSYENTGSLNIPGLSAYCVSQELVHAIPYKKTSADQVYPKGKAHSNNEDVSDAAAAANNVNEDVYDAPYALLKTFQVTLPNKNSTYQQLNPLSQREPSEYQALDFKNKTDV